MFLKLVSLCVCRLFLLSFFISEVPSFYFIIYNNLYKVVMLNFMPLTYDQINATLTFI